MPSVLITGCDSGLGREFALQYAQEGFSVWATYRDMASALPDTRMQHHPLDVTDLGHPKVVTLIADAVRSANGLGKPVGTVGPTVDAITKYREMGFDFLAIGSELGLLMRILKQTLEASREVLKDKAR